MSRAVTAALICLALVCIDHRVALGAAGLLIALYSAIYHRLEELLDRVGRERMQLNQEQHRTVQQSLSAVKEARGYPCRMHYLEAFVQVNRRLSDQVVARRMMAEVARYFTEILAVTTIVGVMVYFSLTAGSPAVAFSMVSLFLMATWRLVPAIQQVYSRAVDVRVALPLVERVLAELQDTTWPAALPDGPRIELREAIRVEGAQFAYPEANRSALADVSVEFARGSSTGLVGRTGSGKSTLADVIAGYLRPERGRVTIDGAPPDDGQIRGWQKNVGYVPQATFLIDDTVRRNIALGVPDGAVAVGQHDGRKLVRAGASDKVAAGRVVDCVETLQHEVVHDDGALAAQERQHRRHGHVLLSGRDPASQRQERRSRHALLVRAVTDPGDREQQRDGGQRDAGQAGGAAVSNQHDAQGDEAGGLQQDEVIRPGST